MFAPERSCSVPRGQQHLELGPNAARKVIRTLQLSLDGQEDPSISWARVLWYQEYHWGGWARNLERILAKPRERAELKTLVTQTKNHRMAMAVLQGEAAVRLFEHEMGHSPADWSMLVPEYLEAVPFDTYSEPLMLNTSGGPWAVRSRGFEREGMISPHAFYDWEGLLWQ